MTDINEGGAMNHDQREAFKKLNQSLKDLTAAILDLHGKYPTTAESMAAMRRAFGMEDE
jgi:hypothetical protein